MEEFKEIRIQKKIPYYCQWSIQKIYRLLRFQASTEIMAKAVRNIKQTHTKNNTAIYSNFF